MLLGVGEPLSAAYIEPRQPVPGKRTAGTERKMRCPSFLYGAAVWKTLKKLPDERMKNMKKKTVAGFAIFALCLSLLFSTALGETRQGVIYLEGMEEIIEEALFESPEGFSFWCATNGLEADFGTADGIEGVIVRNIYSDDYMVLSMISEEEAAQYAAAAGVDIKAEAAVSRVQVDVSQELIGTTFHFSTLIGDRGRYLRAVGAYSLEAAEGTAKYFYHILNTVTLAHPDDWVGRYTDGNGNTVDLEKREEGYAMSVSLYRLTALDEGTVSFLGERVLFRTLDASGNPMTLSLYQDGQDRCALRVEESTWAYLEPGTVFDGLEKLPD